MPNTPRVFLSYAREDRALVDALARDLRHLKCEPIFDEQLTGGQAWWDRLLDGIEQSDALLPVLSTSYVDSNPCRVEAAYAHALGKPILPIAVETVSTGLLANYLAEVQWVNYDPEAREALVDLVLGIQNLPACPPLPSPLPDRPAVPISYMTNLKQQIESTEDLTRAEQLVLLDQLKEKLGGPDDAIARSLLRGLQGRSDVTVRVANEITELIGAPPAPEAAPQSLPSTQWVPRDAPTVTPVTPPPSWPPPPSPVPMPRSEPWTTGVFIGLILASLFAAGIFGIVFGAVNRKDEGKRQQATALMWIGIAVLILVIVVGVAGGFEPRSK